jgi:hypothetical protein
MGSNWTVTASAKCTLALSQSKMPDTVACAVCPCCKEENHPAGDAEPNLGWSSGLTKTTGRISLLLLASDLIDVAKEYDLTPCPVLMTKRTLLDSLELQGGTGD